MIYCGYENRHFFIRLTHDVRVLEMREVLHDGYRILSGQMVLIKPREVYEDETGFGSMTQGRAYEENY